MIVLAESDVSGRKALLYSLLEKGHAVTAVSSAQELLQHLTNKDLDVLLLHARLPGMGNKVIPLIRKLRSRFSRQELPILLLVDQEDRELVKRAPAEGINGTIRLPLDADFAESQILAQLAMKKDYESRVGKKKQAKQSPLPENTLKVIYNSLPEAEFFTTTTDPEPHFPRVVDASLHYEEEAWRAQTMWLSRSEVRLYTQVTLPVKPKMTLILHDHEQDELELLVQESGREEDARATFPLKITVKVLNAPESYHEMLLDWESSRTIAGPTAIDEETRIEREQAQETDRTSRSVSSAQMALNLINGARYKFERFLGQGSFASVYLVRDMALNRRVAMKVLSADFCKNAEDRAHFVAEARIAARFHHPHIVSVYEVGEFTEDQYSRHLCFPGHILDQYPERMNYFTMEWVEGETLRSWIKKNDRQAEPVAVDILTQVTDALAFAHKKGVIHRDIKPDNIMITDEFQVKVGDFGIAVIVDSEGLSASKAACTPKYASPEQLLSNTVDHRTDIYSVGIVGYELISGRPPFKTKRLQEMARMHLQKQPDPLDCSKSIADIIFKCLAKSPDDRYADADSLYKDLSGVRGFDTLDNQPSLQTNLTGLVTQALAVDNENEARETLEGLVLLLQSASKASEERLKSVRSQLSGSNLVNLLLEKNMNERNVHLLSRFFAEMASPKVVANLMSRFRIASDIRQKRWLAEMVYLSAVHQLDLLVDYGLELSDNDAAILLKCFRDAGKITDAPIFLKWAKHYGFNTQMELLRILSEIDDREVEKLNVLNHFANSDGSTHPKVSQLASLMLQSMMTAQS